MKILYLTTARHPEDYAKFLMTNKTAPNPSNQHFHTKLINLLSEKYEVIAFSTRPMEKDLFLKDVRKDNYFYPGYLNIPYVKKIGILTGGQNLARLEKPNFLVVDVMNTTLLKLARRIKEIYKVPVIGVLTDNPLNITGSKKEYSQSVFKGSKKCDGYIALTNGLVRLFDGIHKPYIISPGFIEKSDETQGKTTKYAFFAGALYERYGVQKLIDTFALKDIPYKLYIAGHGPLAKTLTELKNDNIVFLGHITPEAAKKYSSEALVNINPRPKDEQIDLYSIPSKLLDFINSGTVTISTHNSEIHNLVGDDIYWISDNEPLTIANALKDIDQNYNKYALKATSAKTKLNTLLSSDNQLAAFAQLVEKLKKL
ncbi:MAG: glycosyltransferase [Bacilli bacterium]